MKKKIIIVGKSGSGKDHLTRHLESKGLIKSVSFTNRPLRVGESHGSTYHYLDTHTIDHLIKTNYFKNVESYPLTNENNEVYATWHYCLSHNDWINCDMFIMNPFGLDKTLKTSNRKDLIIIYLDIPVNVRRSRIMKRENLVDRVDRRIAADDKDFLSVTDVDLRITDSFFNVDDIYEQIQLRSKYELTIEEAIKIGINPENDIKDGMSPIFYRDGNPEYTLDILTSPSTPGAFMFKDGKP